MRKSAFTAFGLFVCSLVSFSLFIQDLQASTGASLFSLHRKNKNPLDRVHHLAKNKNIKLIVGRQINEITTHPPLPQEPSSQWVYVDVEEPSFVNQSRIPIQLNMDFADVEDLSEIHAGTVAEIMIDWSTWKFLVANVENTAAQYYRILKPGGKLVFGHEVAGGGITFHREKNREIIYQFLTDPMAPITYLLPEASLLNSGYREQLHREAREEMASRYTNFFMSKGFSSVIYHQNEIYPVANIHATPRCSYFEILK